MKPCWAFYIRAFPNYKRVNPFIRNNSYIIMALSCAKLGPCQICRREFLTRRILHWNIKY
uniref:Uncharacterized protein n=1 Tax=Rhizophora mucronata TaxID=61149 RepID=A0A2P2L3S8_RHIMU